MEKKINMCVAVHKQLLKLGEDETINSFLTKIRDASEAYLDDYLSLSDDRYLWATEVWSDAVVVQVTDYKNRDLDGYYAFGYRRVTESDFQFDEPTKVELRTYYEPAEEQMEMVQKMLQSSENKFWVRKNLWEGLF